MNKIKEFIIKYFNQNNYGTKFPIYFCILDLELRNSPEGEEDFIEYYSPIHGESISKEEYLKLTEEEQEYGEYFPIYQALYPVEKGVFLLEEEARQHLEANHYHYHENAKVYCKHMWKAPETEEFLNNLKELFKRSKPNISIDCFHKILKEIESELSMIQNTNNKTYIDKAANRIYMNIDILKGIYWEED